MITAICAALLFTFVVPFPGGDGATFGAHLLEGADTSSQSTSRRIDLWERAVGYIPDHVIIGAGPGLFASIDPDPFHPILYAHNVFLDVAVELGLIAALVFIAILILGIRGGLMRGQRLPAAMLIAFAGASIFDDALYFPRNGLLVAIAFALILGGEASRRPGPERVEEHEQPDGAHRHRSHRPAPRDREPVFS
jgi:O-antigen ligase